MITAVSVPSSFSDITYVIGDPTVSSDSYAFTTDCDDEQLVYSAQVVDQETGSAVSSPAWLTHDSVSFLYTV